MTDFVPTYYLVLHYGRGDRSTPEMEHGIWKLSELVGIYVITMCNCEEREK